MKQPFSVVAFVGAVLVLFVLLARSHWGSHLWATAAGTIILGFWSAKSLDHERHGAALAAAAFASALGYFAVLRGRDLNWDQLNYHWSSAFLFIHDLYEWNIAPGQGQNWFNPAVYAFQYLIAGSVGTLGLSLFSAAIAAVSAPLLYRIALELQEPERYRRQFAILATLVGLTSPMFLSEVGTTFFDSWAAAFVAGALLAALAAIRSERRRSVFLLAAAGALLGAATGLKLTNGVYALAMAGAVLLCPWPGGRPRALAWLAAGGIAGFLLTGGWWAWFLWTEYGNPFFPQLNVFFGSTLLEGTPDTTRAGLSADVRFIPEHPLWVLAYPLAWALGAEWVSSELWFRDARFGVVFAAAIIAAALHASRRGTSAGEVVSLVPARRLAWAFFGLAFLVWISIFAIHRYLVPLEIMTGVMLMLAALALIRNRLAALLVFAFVSGWLITWSRHPDWGHIPFTEPLVPSLATSALYEPNTLYVLVSDSALGAAVPAMPRETRFVRIGGNLPLAPKVGLGRHVHQIIASHRGPMRTLGYASPVAEEKLMLANFGLSAVGRCRSIAFFNRSLRSCELTYLPPARYTPPPPAKASCAGSCAARKRLGPLF